jgi:hypothetical protein
MIEARMALLELIEKRGGPDLVRICWLSRPSG